jgi:hypothetical protein
MPFKVNSESNVNHQWVEIVDDDSVVVVRVEQEAGKKAVVTSFPKVKETKSNDAAEIQLGNVPVEVAK